MRAVEEHREPQALAGHFIAMCSWNPDDHAVQPQTAKIIGYFARPVGGGVEALQFGEMVTQLLVAKAIQMHAEQDQARKDSEAKELQSKVTAEKEAIQRQIDQVLTVALVSKDFRAADYHSGNISDVVTIELALENKGDKDVAGVKGVTVFKDMFGDTIKRVSLSYDEGIPARKSVTWFGTIKYNQFDNNDVKLKTVDMKKLTFSFLPDTVIFSDGTKIQPASSDH